MRARLRIPVSAFVISAVAALTLSSSATADVVCTVVNLVPQCVNSDPGAGSQSGSSGSDGTQDASPPPRVGCEYVSSPLPGPVERVGADGTVEQAFLRSCVANGVESWADSSVVRVGTGVSVLSLATQAYSEVKRRAPAPVARVAPADFDAHGFVYVQTPAFFWVDQGVGGWSDLAGQAAVPAVSVTLTVHPTSFVVNPGDGSTPFTCAGPPAVFTDAAKADPDSFQGCGYTYTSSSSTAANGVSFPLQVSIVWTASWVATSGQSGVLASFTTVSAVRLLPVAEVQAVVTNQGGHSG